MTGVYIFLADGFEDLEALATNDVLQRGGVETTLLSISDFPYAVSSHGVTVGADFLLRDIDIDHEDTCENDIMIFPGGMPGSSNLAQCDELITAMKGHYAAGGSVAAICAAPGLVLSQLDELQGVKFTCFDGFQQPLIDKGASFVNAPAVRSGRVITGRSAGHAIAFGLEILKLIKGEQVASEVAKAMFLDC